MTISEIKRLFPFDKTEKIKLVSYKFDNQGNPLIVEPEIPKTNEQVDMTKMFEVKTLNDKQEDKLLNILMNTKAPKTGDVIFCYQPRNGVVFFDKDEQILGYIEICFECQKYRVDPGSIKLPDLYGNGFEKLRKLFSQTGITYGTKENGEE